jgi:uncharacterized protein YfaS (alpha-2-macroglobulin family)
MKSFFSTPSSTKRLLAGVVVAAAVVGVAFADTYVAADRVVRAPPAKTEVLPERFLRGFDPITVTFVNDVSAGPGPADDISKLIEMRPSWPGAWTFLDRRTAQFRPAEAWAPLQRFEVKSQGASRVLSTMMQAPESMVPPAGAVGLAPFRTFTLTFPAPLPEAALKKMIRLETRPLPGIAKKGARPIEDFALALLPRSSDRAAAVYAVSFDDDVPEGAVLIVTVALALGDEDTVLWRGRAATRTDFQLLEVSCAGQRLGLVGAPQSGEAQALDCGSGGEEPQLLFSANVGAVSLTAMKALVRLEPAVPDLSPRVFGRRLQLSGRFAPDTLYRLQIGDAPITDDIGRPLQQTGSASVHFFVGSKKPHLRVKQGAIVTEQRGPRMLPISAFGDSRADVRVHRIDPRHAGLWPFPDRPVVIDESSPPPFPGEEPPVPTIPGTVGRSELSAHLRLLSSPLVSRVVSLPTATTRAPTSFGLDLGPLLDEAPGNGVRRPGTYLVGVRRLDAGHERMWTRVEVTNLSLTTVEERSRAVMYVKSVDAAVAVAGASITVEGVEKKTGELRKRTVTTDAAGRAELAPDERWERLVRVIVEKGDDVLIIDPQEPPPRFFNNHWSAGGGWLSMLTKKRPDEDKGDATLGFLFTERPIYRPGEKVFFKGYAREKKAGVLQMPSPVRATKTAPLLPPTLSIRVTRPGGDEVTLQTNTTGLFAADAVLDDKDPVTGWYTARLFVGNASEPVAVRRFQVEAYRIPTFEVRLSGAARVPLDKPFSVRASARYYAGGSVVEQPVRWSVTRRPAWHTPKGLPGFLFASSAQFARAETPDRPEQMSKDGALDDAGSDAFELHPEKDLDGSPRTYRIEATVTGADDQEVSAVTEVLALPPFVLGMKLKRFSKADGGGGAKAPEIVPEVVAVGVDDALRAGQKVNVRLLKRTWHSHLRESHFATGKASYVTEQEDTLVSETTVTSQKTPLRVPLSSTGAGVYIVELVAKDALGRVQTLSADLYIGGEEPVAWQKGQAGVFELVADKNAYSPDETAQVIVKSPFAEATGLLIIEGATQNTYQPFQVRNGAATLSVPLDKKATPNLPVHVVLSRGRLGQSPSDDAPWRPQTVASSLTLNVTPKKNLVDVKVAHVPQARPGETVTLDVTLADDAGRPLAGEATVWLVDEAVLALAREGSLDPLSSLITRNPSDTSVADTRNSILGRLLEDEAPGGDGSEEDAEGKGRAAKRVRKNFQTVPFYKATVSVPASGKARLSVPLSDDLTTFKVRAVVVSGAERFGRHESEIKVRLPVIVQPQLPRFARQGDRFDGGGVARLVEGAPGAAVVKVDYSGPVVERKRSKDIALTLDKAVSVTFPVEVKSDASDAPLTIRMAVDKRVGGDGDAFEVTLPVFPDVAWQTSTSHHAVENSQLKTPGPTETPRPGTARQTVVMTTMPGLLEAISAIDALSSYPHGCLEQKMARLAPYLSLLKVKKSVGGLPMAPSSKGHIERLLIEFSAHQDEKGLYGFWPGSQGDVQLSARAVEFASAAKDAGIVVDDASVARAKDALLSALRSDYRWDAGLSSYQRALSATSLRALSSAGSVDDAYLVDLLRSRSTLDATGRADLVLAATAQPHPALSSDLEALKRELWSSVTFQLQDGKRAVVDLNDPRAFWGGRILGSSTSSMSTVFLALARLDPKNPDLALLLQAILKRGQGRVGFGSTYDNRAVVEAIAAAIAAGAGAGTANVVVKDPSGEKKHDLGPGKAFVRHENVGTTPATLTAKGAPVSVMSTWRSLPKTPGDRLGDHKAGFLVQRSMTIYPVDGSAARRVDDVRAAEVRLQTGDIVEVHTSVTVDDSRSHVAVVVPFAAGFEPMNAALQTASSDAKTIERDSITPTSVARLDHEDRLYFTSLNKGSYSFHMRLKATTPGSYTHPGAFAELMYNEAVFGRSVGSRIIIERGPEEAGAE